MIKDSIVVGLFVLSFAALVTLHVAICARLILRAPPRWRGLVALALPPFGLVYAIKEGWRGYAVSWAVALVVCVVARLIALA